MGLDIVPRSITGLPHLQELVQQLAPPEDPGHEFEVEAPKRPDVVRAADCCSLLEVGLGRAVAEGYVLFALRGHRDRSVDADFGKAKIGHLEPLDFAFLVTRFDKPQDVLWFDVAVVAESNILS